MKKLVSLLLAGVLTIGVLTRCQTQTGTTSSGSDSSDAASKALSGSISLNGSTSMADVSNALAEKFQEKNSGVTITVGGNGSGEAPTSVNDNTAQIGLLSRELKDSENPDSFDQYIIGYDGIAVIVNSANAVDGLTNEQIAKIFTGAITNWKDVGGADEKIVVYGREAASGTRSAFEELVKLGDEDITDKCKLTSMYNSTGALKQAVAGNKSAIGYVSLSSVDDTVKAIKVDGITISEATIKDGTYSIQRPFLMITKKSTTNEIVKAFLEFIRSDEGQTIITEDGVVPNKW